MDEGMLGCMRESDQLSRVDHNSASVNSVHLASFLADNLKYTQTDALEDNKCLFGSTHEAALMEKSMNGENIAC
jgi:hypothetical protein